MMQGIMMSLGVKNNIVGIDPAGLVEVTSNNNTAASISTDTNNNNTTANTAITVTPAVITTAASTPAKTTADPNRTSAVSRNTAPIDVSDAANMRILANEATSKFKIAEVEKELEIERLKNVASNKLSLRLKLKNKGKPNTTADPVVDSATVPDTTASGKVIPSGSGSRTVTSTEEEEAEMHRIKVEKLRQHKMQENRRNQSMHVAKERSSQALQKRLDELAAKKKAMMGNTLTENSDEEDSSEDDSR
jgi:hypothetical protein